MSEFFHLRLGRHLKKMMKYMRYVFNDHFVLVCLFLVGGLGFYYSQILKTLPEGFYWGRPLVLIVWLVSLQIGRLATLTEEADKVFLLPKEPEMKSYLNRALRYSLWLPFITLLLISGMSMPLVVIATGHSFSDFFIFLLMLFCLKASQLFLQKYSLYQLPINAYTQWYMLWVVLSALIIGGSLYLSPWLGLLGALVELVVFVWCLSKKEAEVSLDWEKMIQKEKGRMYRIYQFIHLFTDVPEITSSVKRRKFLDPLLRPIKPKQRDTYLYLYARRFVRGSEYSGLFVRLVLVAGIILLFLKEFWISLGISMVFIYLIGFQLIPIYTQFDYMVMTHLYPVPTTQKKQAVSQLITALLLIAALLFSLFVVLVLPNKLESLLVAAALLIEVGIFVKVYIPYRLKKMEA